MSYIKYALRQGWDKPVRLNLRRRLVPGRRPMERRKVRSRVVSFADYCAFSISNKYIPDIAIPEDSGEFYKEFYSS